MRVPKDGCYSSRVLGPVRTPAPLPATPPRPSPVRRALALQSRRRRIVGLGAAVLVVGLVVVGVIGPGVGSPGTVVAGGAPSAAAASAPDSGWPGATAGAVLGTSGGAAAGGAAGAGSSSGIGQDTSSGDGTSTAASGSPTPSGPIASPVATPIPSPSGPPTLTPALSSALTKQLAQLRSAWAIPGISASIIFPNGRTWNAHSGYLDVAAKTPVANSTPFAVASVSKTFLAALVVQLSQQGRFALTDSVSTWLPDADLDPRITILELLNHTSGLYDYFSNSKIDAALLGCRTCVWTPAQALSYEKKALFPPGTSWAYSNTGYVLLGELVDQVTGTSYATLLQQRFFGPLGLTSTYVQYLQPAPKPIAHAYQFFTNYRSEKPTSLWDGTGITPFTSVLTAAGSAGSVASSARDLAVWARALYSGQVLGPTGLTQMLDFAPTKSFFRYNDPYGLGVQQYPINGYITYGHDGRLLGARSTVRYIPSLGVSIAVVINTDRGDSAGIAAQLLTLVAPPAPKPTPSPSPLPSPTEAASATP